MHARAAALLGLAVLVALAGCSTLGLDGSSGDFDDVAFPDGTTADGITNATAVFDAHQERLAADSYRIAYNASVSTPDSSGDSSTIIASNETQGRQLETTDLPRIDRVQFRTADRMVQRQRVQSQTLYDGRDLNGSMAAVHRSGAAPGPLLGTIVSTGEFTANATGTENGHQTVTFRATATRENASGQLPEEIDEYEATVQVDESGLIRSADLFATGWTQGHRTVYDQTYRTIERGSVNVSRPAWVDDAIEQVEAGDANASTSRAVRASG